MQPEGVHGPSEVVKSFSDHTPGWSGRALEDYVVYELHVGTFTPEGTFDAAALQLPELKKLGITMIEVMPVAEFPGRFNWGYEGEPERTAAAFEDGWLVTNDLGHWAADGRLRIDGRADDAIAALLKQHGFDCARRTVVKYREAMGIGSSIQRRRERKITGG